MNSHGQADNRFGPADRLTIVAGSAITGDNGGVFRKAARLCAVRMAHPFEVETDQGIVAGKAGDWLATNHPDDDPGSDVWVVSAERMAATYERVDG